MNEVKATPLSHFEMDDYHFGSPAIKRMEFLVLDTLNWRMKSITPFTFIAYFISKFYSDDSTPTDAYTKAVILVMGAMRGIFINVLLHGVIVIDLILCLSCLVFGFRNQFHGL